MIAAKEPKIAKLKPTKSGRPKGSVKVDQIRKAELNAPNENQTEKLP